VGQNDHTLALCIGICFQSGANNDYLLHPDGMFVWTDQMPVQLGGAVDKRMHVLLQML
jgi:hypothetical protein